MKTFDVAVIGAGVVGCAIARELSRDRSVLVLERNASPGLENSTNNSGVLHSGIHLPPEFLKAHLAARGRMLAIRFCEEHGVAVRRTGMYIVVAAKDAPGLLSEVTNLRKMRARAHALGIRVERVMPWTLRDEEPEIRGLFAMRIPDVHIVDAPGFVNALAADAVARGAEFYFKSPAVSIKSGSGNMWIVESTTNWFVVRSIINATGLGAVEVARMAGYDGYRQFYYRGEYYEVDPRAGLRVHSLVYPVHRPGNPGLGVHITPTIDGRVLLGPNAVRVPTNSDYANGRMPPEAFFNDVRRFFPRLRVQNLVPAHAGIRPKLKDGKGENDFQIVRETTLAPFINLIGIESPGLTASMAIAEHVHSLLDN